MRVGVGCVHLCSSTAYRQISNGRRLNLTDVMHTTSAIDRSWAASSFLLKSTNFSSMEMTSDDQEILFRSIDPKTIYSIKPERQFVFLMYFSQISQHPSTPTGMALR